MSVQHVKLRTCFISSTRTESHERSVGTLVKTLKEYGYEVFRRTEAQLKKQDVMQMIEYSELFVAVVSKDYFDNILDEFYCAWDRKMPILCLFSSAAIENNSKKYNTEIQIMLKLFYIQLPKNTLSNNVWRTENTNEILSLLNKMYETRNDRKKFKKLITLSIPNKFEIENLCKIQEKNHFKELFSRGTIFNVNSLIVISDGKLNLIDCESLDISTVLDCKVTGIKDAHLISVNTKRDILILDNHSGSIHVFDSEFNKKHNIDQRLHDYCDMTIDEDTNDVYLIKSIENPSIVRIDHLSKELHVIDWTKINQLISSGTFKPKTIKVVNNKIIILNACSLRMNKKRQIEEIESGASHIYTLDKETLELKQMIDFNNWAQCQPWGLIVDRDSNIYTTVFQIEEKTFLSKERYLCKIDKNGNIISKSLANLESTFLPNDLFYISNKLFLFKENQINVYSSNKA